MATRETVVHRGRRTALEVRRRLGAELRRARLGAGLSQRALGGLTGMSHSAVGRIERGTIVELPIRRVAILATALGLDLRIALFPVGSPLRDRAHLALIDRLRRHVASTLRWRTEVPVPIPGDLRSADVVIDAATFDVLVEAETHVDDVQALLRRIAAKQRDLGATRVILLLADTRHHRSILAAHPELRERFPIRPRSCLAALRAGRDPDGDAILLL